MDNPREPSPSTPEAPPVHPEPTDAAGATVPPLPPPRQRSYVVRHWRGDLPLPVAYWVSSILGALVTGGSFLLLRVIDVTKQPRAWALYAIAAWLFFVTVEIWLLVGTWRSAGGHPGRGGSEFWAGAARFVVFVGGVVLATTIASRAAPQVAEFSRIAFGASEIAGSRVRVIRDGTEIEVNGQLGFGIAEEFRRALDANLRVLIVHLNSNGGRTMEAMALARIIRDRRLSTYVATECLSACVTAFAAGEERWISRTAAIGLHAPSLPGLSTTETDNVMADQRAFIAGRGVDQAFLDRGFSTPNSGMWRPTHEELFAARLATSYAPANGVGVSGASARELEDLAGGLLKTPVYAALKEADPTLYAALVRDFEEGFRLGWTIEQIRAATYPKVAAVLARSLPHASNEALRRFGEVLLAEGRALQESEPPKCAALFAGSTSLETLYAIPKELRNRELEVQADVILSAAREPHLTQALDELQPQLSEALASMPPAARADMDRISDPEMPRVAPARYCATILAFYDAIQALPDAKAGPLMRALFGAVPAGH